MVQGGVIVAIVYASSSQERVDMNSTATKGFPSSDGRSLPVGRKQCPLPDFVVAHFASYKGPALLSKKLAQNMGSYSMCPSPCLGSEKSGSSWCTVEVGMVSHDS